MNECTRECANARERKRERANARTMGFARPNPPHRAVASHAIDRSRARPRSIASIASHSTVARSTHGRARSRRPGARSVDNDVAPRDARALARRFGARAERRSTARAGDDARDDGEARVARRATGTRDRDAAETTGGDPGGRARDAGAEDREARTTGDGWANVRDVRGGEDVEMAKDG
jgi:hypothetical protein